MLFMPHPKSHSTAGPLVALMMPSVQSTYPRVAHVLHTRVLRYNNNYKQR